MAINPKYVPAGIEILHEDRDLLVISKAAGLLTVDDGRDSRTAYSALTHYVKKGQTKSRNRLFIVHRLDRDTSGLLIFAKNEEAKTKLQQSWDTTEKIYRAIVDGRPDPPDGKVQSFLTENSALRVFSTKDGRIGKLSVTDYKTIKPIGTDRTLVELKILTGRKHQIRVHMADLGHPVVGDSKYGQRIKGLKRIALHAYKLSFAHPFSGENLTFEASVPANFFGMGGMKSEPSEAKEPKKGSVVAAKREKNRRRSPRRK